MMDDGPFSKGHIDQKLFMYAESGQNRQNIPFPKCNIISFLTLLHLLRVFCLVVAGVSLAAASSDKYFNQEVDKTTGGFLEPEEEVNLHKRNTTSPTCRTSSPGWAEGVVARTEQPPVPTTTFHSG